MKVGIIGAGQLGRMLGIAGIPLAIECGFLTNNPSSPAAVVGDVHIGSLDDPDSIRELAKVSDVITPEIENVSIQGLHEAEQYAPVYPSSVAIAAAQDRLREKALFREFGIPTAPFVAIDRARDLDSAADAFDWPILLKARRLGYDGRGQRIARSAAELHSAWSRLGEVPALAEAWVEFEHEVSLIAVRDGAGNLAFYPLCENVHKQGMLSTTVAPYEDPDLQTQAERWLTAIMRQLDYRGILTVEFFHTADGLVANEMAPRVHNSGHWTIEGAETSQFENHLRAICGLPLGDVTPRGYAAMVNLVGEVPSRDELLAIPGLHLHQYGKEARPGRKLGHCTMVDLDRHRLMTRLSALTDLAHAGNP